MLNQEMIRGNWNEIKGKLRSRWGQLTEDELEQAHGNVEELLGTIQRKTGSARAEIEEYLSHVSSGTASAMERASETARHYADAASERVQETSRYAMDAARHGYDQAQHTVQSRPFESLAVCFGIGLAAGVIVGMALRSR